MEAIDTPVTFGEWIKQRRRVLDLTQSELADRAGCSVFALRKIESGERRPSKQLASLLANALDIAADELPQFLKVARGEINLERLRSAKHNFPTSPPAKPASDTTKSHLPLFPNPFIGREQEAAALTRLLGDSACRLLTLIGPGGIGKTRLAVEVAARNHAGFSDGAWFVSLAGVRAPNYVVPTMADTLGISFQGHDQPSMQLIRYLQQKNILLVVDNIEHLLDDLAIYADILANAPGVKILVTSRERLNLQGEWVFEIQGLPTPLTDLPEHPEEFSSLTLFQQAARRIKFDFALKPAELPAITRICRLMEGMPLGIELAAGWVATLSCAEIAQEMERSLDFLRSSYKNVPERQRSLRAAFDYSWSLLPNDERSVLARLSVFQGGFEREQAEQVAGASLVLLHSLTGRSLVRRKQYGRFDLHEAVRQYAYERLSASSELEDVLNSHAAAYLSVFEKLGGQLKTTDQIDAMRVLRQEMNNLRSAWARAVRLHWFDSLGRCIRHLGWFCDLAGLLVDGIEMLEKVIERLAERTEDPFSQRLIGMSRGQQGLLYFRRGYFEQAIQSWDEALSLLTPLDDPEQLTDPLIFKGVIFHLNGQYEESRALLEAGLKCAREAGDNWSAGYATFNLGFLASLQGDYANGYQQMLSGMGLRRRTGDPSTIALGLNHISITALRLNLISEAKGYLEESIGLCTQVGDRWGLGTAIRYLGLAYMVSGDLAQAHSLLEQSLAILGEITTGWDMIRSNIYLAEVCRLEGNLEEAWKIGAAAFVGAKEVESVPLALEALAGLARLKVENSPSLAYTWARFILNTPQATALTREMADAIVSEIRDQLSKEELRLLDQTALHLTLDSLNPEP